MEFTYCRSRHDGNGLAVLLRKGSDTYLFEWTRGDNVALLLRILGRFAASEDLNFSWVDAAAVSEMIRKLSS